MYEVADLQACELEGLVAFLPEGIRVSVVEERDSMGFPRVSVSADSRDALLEFVRYHWGDDEATGGWYSEHVLPQVQDTACANCGSVDLCYGVDEHDDEDGTYVCETCDHEGRVQS